MEMKDQVSLQGKEEDEPLLSPLTSSEEEKESKGEVESQAKNRAFRCLSSLEDSLPTKRGLSGFFSGKSKSFSSLLDMGNMSTSNLTKTENSFNKRRRIRMASKARRASYTSFTNLPPPPPPSLKDHILEEGGNKSNTRRK